MKINKILVANRGEIALRVMRSAKEMGIKTVAVFSEADRNMPFVRYADEAVCIGAAPSKESYLRIDKIIAAAKQTNTDAIHPGYGFLSENAHFASAVKDAGLIFIGPSPESIEIMGSKLGAKAAVAPYNIPTVPGSKGAISDIAEAKKIAAQVGYPILIKASAGGGGKGMKLVENEAEFDEQMTRAISEAQSAFGDSSVFVEKFITSPKHIEVQILGDQHGNVIYLFERECSIQRRHQKVIEEAPSSCLTPEIRQKIGEAAVMVAKSCGYYNAGTVEFVADHDLNFYFLEMNTRLQVEHAVTEMITDLDLVKLQIEIAEGKPLAIKQEDLHINGHAMEIRVYAEDPTNNFLPDIGQLKTYRAPKGNGVRVDDGFEEGMQIPIYYDPMIAKLVTHGKDRNEAIIKMIRAIDDYKITGVQNTLAFCKFVLQHESFISGKFDTKFVEQYFKPELLKPEFDEEEAKVAMVALFDWLEKQQTAPTNSNNTTPVKVQQSNWKKRLKS